MKSASERGVKSDIKSAENILIAMASTTRKRKINNTNSRKGVKMNLIIVIALMILAFGIREKALHQKNVDAIPIRVNVNGIRGKSTVTRLMTGILTAAEYKVVGKTTGTAARMIYWNTKEETPIERRPEGPNIGEQRKVVAKAAKLGAEVLVSECMAVTPDYQIIFQEQLLQANIGVIVNVLEDHMDVMGPTLDTIAEAFIATIPYGGKLIVSNGPYESYFTEIAKKRETEVFLADTSIITEEQMRQFGYIVFPENVALALALAQALNIDEKTAWEGMLKANPDPGILRIYTLSISGKTTYFVNAFAANDATSTLAIWQRVIELGYPADNSAIVMNCRSDRVDRSIQFAQEVFPFTPSSLFICMGSSTKPVLDVYSAGKITTEEFYDAKAADGFKIYKDLEEKIAGKVIFGVGNIHGTAEEFIEALLSLKPELDEQKKKNWGKELCTEQNCMLPL